MMNEINDRLEILIGRLVDGEISPVERKILDRELETNSQARELLEQLRNLHQQSCQAIAAEVSGGASADELFERAWRQNEKSTYRRIFRIDGRLRFAVGLAAGLILGLALHFLPVWGSKAPVQIDGPRQFATDTPGGADRQGIVPVTVSHGGSRPVSGEVDCYVFTSPSGEQWLVEGVREGLVKTADYRGKSRPM
jgi:anti-sigma factor RsiW